MIVDVLREPRVALEAVAWERRLWGAVAVVILWASANSVLTLILFLGSDLRAQFPQLSPASLDRLETILRVLAPVSAFLVPLAWWIGVSALMMLATRLFGGRAGFSTMLAVVGAACVPWVLGYLIQLPLGMIQLFLPDRGTAQIVPGLLAFLVSLASLVWHVVLVVIGGKFATGTGYRGAGASCAFTGLGCATALFVLAISMLTLVFTLSGAI